MFCQILFLATLLKRKAAIAQVIPSAMIKVIQRRDAGASLKKSWEVPWRLEVF